MTLATADRVQCDARTKVYDGLTFTWLSLAGERGTVQQNARGLVWVIFDDDLIHERFGAIPLYHDRLHVLAPAVPS